ncbi:hypothetical protein AB3R30_06865 [Leptolyngbyaceae cyanobacterium UHCC 1019]
MARSNKRVAADGIEISVRMQRLRAAGDCERYATSHSDLFAIANSLKCDRPLVGMKGAISQPTTSSGVRDRLPKLK